MQEPRPTIAPYAVVVDDNPVILLHATDILSDAGFSVFSAPDSNTALDCLDLHGEAIVLLFANVEIPGPIDGFGLARFASGRWPSTAILVSSGRHTPRQGDMPKEAVFLPKPYSADDVLRCVRIVLDAKNPHLIETRSLVF